MGLQGPFEAEDKRTCKFQKIYVGPVCVVCHSKSDVVGYLRPEG